MFSSFPALSNPFSVPRIFRPTSKAVSLPSVQIYDVETDPDKRARTLKHLLKLNHAEHAIIYHNLRYHNHMPHILGSAYILQSSSSHLQDIYEEESRSLEPWRESPGEISDYDWRDYLADRRYQRAYVDFFEDQLVQNGYDWKGVVRKYLFEDKKEPLGNNLVAGLGHCLIHLGYAFELSSREIAMEALGLTACFYNFMHKYLDDPSYTRPPPSSVTPSTSTLEILHRIRQDERFSDVPSKPGAIGIEDLFKTHEEAILEHWNSWILPDPTNQFAETQKTPVALLVGTQYPPSGKAPKEYDFFFVHLLTTSHALRILLPLVDDSWGRGGWHASLLRQWWLFVLAVYIAQGRPEIDVGRFLKKKEEGEDDGRGWEYVDEQAVKGEWSLDAHFVKALRSMQVAGETWREKKDEDGQGMEKFFLRGAVKMAEEFNGWGGFGALGEEEGGGGH